MFCYVCILWCIVSLVKYMPILLAVTFVTRCMNLVNTSQGVLDGKYDDLSEQAFYMVGGIEEVIAKAEKIAKENA